MNCVFCSILAGSVQAQILAEDELTVSFLDIRQSNHGHCLIIPKQHIERIYDLPADIAGALFAHTTRVARALQDTIHPDGIQVWQSNGKAAGQEVDHAHIHVFPRYHGDGHFRIYPEPPNISTESELEAIAAPIRAALQTS